jgi:hypothetical protein
VHRGLKQQCAADSQIIVVLLELAAQFGKLPADLDRCLGWRHLEI